MMEECMKNTKIDFSVDSKIEQCFIDACEDNKFGFEIRDTWRCLKKRYVNVTKTTVYEFMNYSMHDETHSQSILNNIERIIGLERIKELNMSDLFIILNVCYAHDVGMSIDYEEMVQIWKSSDFQEKVSEWKYDMDEDLSQAAKNYDIISKCLGYRSVSGTPQNHSEKLNFKNPDVWPLEFRKDVTVLLSEYIRRFHGNRSKSFFKNQIFFNCKVVPERLFDLIAKICEMHTMDIKDIITGLSERCNGFQTDTIHPMFIAILLRMGDLLDIDNNRFDIFNVRHFGTLPHMSLVNFGMHKSINHFFVSQRKIEITAETDNFETAILVHNWFRMIEEETNSLMLWWEKIAPTCLKGCMMGRPELTVKYKQSKFDTDLRMQFEIDTDKLLNLFAGENLYETKLAFLREYIQNALDSSRIQLWYEITDKNIFRHNSFFIPDAENVDFSTLKPTDLKKETYDNFKIQVIIGPGQTQRSFRVKIKDAGIGLSKEDLNCISKIGSGWRSRKEYTKEIRSMPQWMRPTGGFGIGMQSAFMITDCVRLKSKSEYSDPVVITLMKKSKTNQIAVELDEDNYGLRGCTVEVEILIDDFFKAVCEENLLTKLNVKQADRYEELIDFIDYDEVMGLITDIFAAYVQKNFAKSIMPIEVSKEYKNGLIEKNVRIQNDYLFSNATTTRDDIISLTLFENNLFVNSFSNRFYYGRLFSPRKNNPFVIWDQKRETYFYFKLINDDTKKTEIKGYYKNVFVAEKKSDSIQGVSGKLFNYEVDIMGRKVRDVVNVSRSKFIPNLDVLDRKDAIFTVLMPMFYQYVIKNSSQIDNNTNLIFALLIELIEHKTYYRDKEEYETSTYIDSYQVNTIKLFLNKEIKEKKYVSCTKANLDMNGIMGTDDRIYLIYKTKNSLDTISSDEEKNAALKGMKRNASIFSDFLKETESDCYFIQDDLMTSYLNEVYANTSNKKLSYLTETDDNVSDFMLKDFLALMSIESCFGEKYDYSDLNDVECNVLVIDQYLIKYIMDNKNKKEKPISTHIFHTIDDLKRCVIYADDVSIREQYAPLLIKGYPFSKTNEYCIISPFSNNTAGNVKAKIRNNKEQNFESLTMLMSQFSLEMFMKIVTEDNTFEDLVRYVQDKNGYSYEEIYSAYEKYIKNIYKNMKF